MLKTFNNKANFELNYLHKETKKINKIQQKFFEEKKE